MPAFDMHRWRFIAAAARKSQPQEEGKESISKDVVCPQHAIAVPPYLKRQSRTGNFSRSLCCLSRIASKDSIRKSFIDYRENPELLRTIHPRCEN
jgi:hypothetical protein